MDPVTQGALGAVAAALVAKRPEARLAILVGWGAGMLADADIFITSEEDALLNIEYHRHFSHSLIFIPIGALIAAGGFWLILRQWLDFARIYLFSLCGYATAGLLDACTSYGTRLLWPFADTRVAWNIISIIDPVFTGALLISIIVILVTRSARRWGMIGLSFAMLYLGVGVVQNVRASAIQSELAISRGHVRIEKATVKPSIGNLILWRSIYRHEGRWYVDGIRAGLSTQIYHGDSTPEYTLPVDLPPETQLWRDLQRFEHFSDGYLALEKDRPDVVIDLRYSAIPNSLAPLWGIEIDRSAPDVFVKWVTFRSIDRETRDRFFGMVRGVKPPK